MRLSQHFKAAEFTCKCGCGAFAIDSKLIAALEALRAIVAKPIIINSGYRCKEHNRKVGGAQESQHTKGKAADIRVTGVTVDMLAAIADEVPAFAQGGIGIYRSSGFVHVDVRGRRARWAA